ncbi:hypothetical protein U0070_004374 [Myodes glareolus]|uniref:Uncharacterized protein n=1 Tax=Myodes glareolus TaxID=447135 RepID=A0AAW0ISM3_MYOGA
MGTHQSEVHFVLDVQMTQMLQMNPTVQLEVELMAEDFSKEGVPAFIKVEFVESIDILPGKCITIRTRTQNILTGSFMPQPQSDNLAK